MVTYAPKNGEAKFIDVFNGGKILTRGEAEAIVLDLTGEGLREEQVKAASKKEIIVRMLHNLTGVAERTESNNDSLRYLDLILALTPDSAADRLQRARMRLQTNDTAGAKQDLRWLLDHEPVGVDLERVAELYHSL
jgi:regulator of sirC expression with transglutaminase-like and TPR domain